MGGGELHIENGSNVLFEGEVSGSAVVTESGTMTFEDIFSPGDNPALGLGCLPRR